MGLCERCGQEIDEKLVGIAKKYEIKFKCVECGNIYIGYRPTLNKVFVWPDGVPEMVNGIIIPEVYRQSVTGYGIVIAVGSGYYSKSKKAFVPPTLKVGDRIAYNSQIPWRRKFDTMDGDWVTIPVMGELDVLALVSE